jgi:uncharacterized NAD-dependent epimerase/dehydratase family protein
MTGFPEGRAIVYCEGAFDTPYGKTAHGLVRRTLRYSLLSVIDSRLAGRDAGELLDGKACGIPVLENLDDALEQAKGGATHFVIGLAPDGGRLSAEGFEAAAAALQAGLNVDCGLHSFLSENPELAKLAAKHGATIRDVRKPPPRDELHFFSGKIAEVESFKIALLGTDSAVGKRTTAWFLVDALRAAGHPAEMIGTGQTAWMQGARYSIILDSLVNDFVAGEIEHVIWRCWSETKPEAMVLEGQGSLMNPAYPGGMELLAAGRADVVVLQHAPARTEYDGFPGHALHPLEHQIRAVEVLSGKKVIAVTLNHEKLEPAEVRRACAGIRAATGLPAIDVLLDGPEELVTTLKPYLARVQR